MIGYYFTPQLSQENIFLSYHMTLNSTWSICTYLKPCFSNFNMCINHYWYWSNTDTNSVDLGWVLRFYISQMITMLLTDGEGRSWRVFPNSSRCPKICLWFKLNLQRTEYWAILFPHHLHHNSHSPSPPTPVKPLLLNFSLVLWLTCGAQLTL